MWANLRGKRTVSANLRNSPTNFHNHLRRTKYRYPGPQKFPKADMATKIKQLEGERDGLLAETGMEGAKRSAMLEEIVKATISKKHTIKQLNQHNYIK